MTGEPVDLKAFKQEKANESGRRRKEAMWDDLTQFALKHGKRGADPWYGLLGFVQLYARDTGEKDIREDQALADAIGEAATRYLKRRDKTDG